MRRGGKTFSIPMKLVHFLSKRNRWRGKMSRNERRTPSRPTDRPTIACLISPSFPCRRYLFVFVRRRHTAPRTGTPRTPPPPRLRLRRPCSFSGRWMARMNRSPSSGWQKLRHRERGTSGSSAFAGPNCLGFECAISTPGA